MPKNILVVDDNRQMLDLMVDLLESEGHRVVTAEDGFSDIKAINYMDGIRIYFSNNEISHLRPSGNAPEFRNYAIADSPERAKEIVRIGIEKIIPILAKKAKTK